MSLTRSLTTCLIFSTIPAAAAAAAAQPATSPAAMLGATGLDVAVGDGEMNGVAFEIGVVRATSGGAASLGDLITARLAGRAAITENQTPQGKLIIAWNLRSDGCPGCAALDRASVDTLLESAVAITPFELPGGGALAIATPAGPLLRAAGSSATYRGALRREALGPCLMIHQTIYRFEGSVVSAHVGTSPESPRVLAGRMRDALTRDGFSALTSTGLVDGASVGAGVPAGTFFKGTSAVHYRVTPADGGSRLEINESTAPTR